MGTRQERQSSCRAEEPETLRDESRNIFKHCASLHSISLLRPNASPSCSRTPLVSEILHFKLFGII